MDGPHKRNATYADIEALPEGTTGELIDGDLYVSGRPRVRHSAAVSAAFLELGPAMPPRGPKGWHILFEVEIWFGRNQKNLLVPDLAGWRRERMPDIPDVQTLELVPDWVCEGLSPSTMRRDKGRKREIYEKHKVGHVWYADPKNRMLEVLELTRGSYRLVTIAMGDQQVVLPPFAHEIDVGRFWRR
ncbi:MAG TPA: Uma2 family endonuclease [Kofleriaceae bacterium]|jgi:Uma2 family endonuclease|nr:Uma2 family endonuclease [Kofleriaceae bacterium]